MPMTSSMFSPTTGIREKPLRSARDNTWRTFLSRSAKTMSVLGTMTSRTIVSPSSNTEWIIARSPGSMTLRSSRRSTRPRSSSSDSPEPSRPLRPGVSALAVATSSRGSGPSARTTGASTRAAASASCRSNCRPRVTGQIPAMMYSTAAMPANAMRNVCQPVPSHCTRAAVVSTTAAVSAPTRTARSTLRCRRGSAKTACNCGEWPFGPSLARSLPPVLAVRSSAISALAHRPASTASATAAATSQPIAASPGFPACLPVALHCSPARHALGAPRVQQPVLQPEHGGTLPRLGVVKPEQVKDAVRAEHLQFLLDRPLRLPGLFRGHLRAQDHVTEHRRGGAAVGGPGPVGAVAPRWRRAQLVHGEREHVGGTFLAHPALVQVGDGGDIHEQYG